jgi:hypothetical protein
MLTIFKNKQNISNYKLPTNNYVLEKNTKIQSNSEKGEYEKTISYAFPSKEWFTNIYSYNKHYVIPLISYNTILNKLFRSYCNMLQEKINILYKRRRDNKIRYSANKLHISRAELDHTNTTILITLYIYNKKKSLIQLYIKSIMVWIRLKKRIAEGKSIFIPNNNRLFHSLKNKFSIFKESSVVFFTKRDNTVTHLLLKIKNKCFI